MNENKEITRETYIRKKLSAEIGELKDKIAELEFSVLFLQEKNAELKNNIRTLEEQEGE